ncbi:heme-binding beta-barrel domain-containing protein [Psychromonas ossibalaenae]|uniref:heme-binding beta-barrel domain-containing protein n=1 Tax=Psychromonas ossibalaenae TaxID=444922 RepID=UPI00036D118C|nr:heme-binding beta-barrel domain-containing protein [Psychromonas ossibalaenae]
MSDNTEINYGPLAGLIGVWSGNKGTDLAPEPDGTETNEYYETITFTEAGDVSNAEEQVISAVHYMQKVQRISNDKVIHQETGYWMWEQDSNRVMHSLTIPRGMAVLAGGSFKEQENITFDVQASIDSKDWQLIQSPFMREKAKLQQYVQQVILEKNSLSYRQTMVLDIYGRVFDHTDQNTLQRR